MNVAIGPLGESDGGLMLGINDGTGAFKFSTAETADTQFGNGTFLPAGSFTDLDGDGTLDAVVGFEFQDCCHPAANWIIIKREQPDGTFAETRRWALAGQPESIVTADFDGNGKPDIAVITWDSHASSGTDLSMSVYLNKTH